MPSDWRYQIRAIAEEWLFADIPKGRLPHNIVLPLENPDLYNESIFLAHLSNVERFRSISIGRYQGHPVGVLKSKFGGPAVAMVIDLLAGIGMVSVIGIGYCGALHQGIKCGDLVLPLASIREDGITTRYVEKGYPAVADLDGLTVLLELAQKSRHPWHCGMVWSTDAVLLESSAVVEQWVAQGVLAVDMEMSALLTIARLLGLRANGILVASDHAGLKQKAIPEACDRGFAAAIELGFEWSVRMAGSNENSAVDVNQSGA